MEKERVKIKDYLFFQEGPGVRNTQYTLEGVKLLNVANLVDGKVDLSTSNRYISEEEANGKYKHFLVDEGDLIVASSGIKVEYMDKKMGFAKREHLPLCMNTSTIRFKSLNRENLDIRYFMYFLKSLDFKKQLNKEITGSAQLNYGPSHLNKMTFILVSKEKQLIIIKKLESIEKMIDLYQSQLKSFDLLVKSRFVEMFDNNKYKEVNISEVVVDKPSNGYFAKREEYDDNGNVKILGVVNVVNTMYSKIENLPKTNAKQSDIDKYVIKYGDILFCRSSLVAEGIGKASVVPQNVENNTLFECHVIRLKLDLKKVIPEYLQVLTTTDYFRSQILTSAKTATMTTIGQDGIMKCNIKLPPLSVQKEFYDFVDQVDKSKFVVQEALTKTKILMDSLMQEYFG